MPHLDKDAVATALKSSHLRDLPLTTFSHVYSSLMFIPCYRGYTGDRSQRSCVAYDEEPARRRQRDGGHVQEGEHNQREYRMDNGCVVFESRALSCTNGWV